MKMVTWNVNGIRSVFEKGFERWLSDLKADIVCLQEVKAHPSQLEKKHLEPKGYLSFWHPAEKLGYSGVMVFTKKEPLKVTYGIGKKEIDREGRVIQLEFPEFTLLNAYFPNSQRDHSRLGYKLAFCDEMLEALNTLRFSGKAVLLCGDFNIAHKEIDLRNPSANKDNAGFLPQERAWMDRLVGAGYVDAFREFEKGPDQYTWWSYRPTIRERNIGWRLDYWVANEEWKGRLKRVTHQTQVMGSDHCPVVLELKR